MCICVPPSSRCLLYTFSSMFRWVQFTVSCWTVHCCAGSDEAESFLNSGCHLTSFTLKWNYPVHSNGRNLVKRLRRFAFLQCFTFILLLRVVRLGYTWCCKVIPYSKFDAVLPPLAVCNIRFRASLDDYNLPSCVEQKCVTVSDKAKSFLKLVNFI